MILVQIALNSFAMLFVRPGIHINNLAAALLPGRRSYCWQLLYKLLHLDGILPTPTNYAKGLEQEP